ncbi:hypothetical protein JJD41_08400 [Oxynema sp. CENA135]|uniref:hypothetical protein n=1 Tax=Oxynema sp. CENA135 TaxID=984206 RepID=UPI00190C8881|nr:hypothetical protein [Oxynema sp. CENA135]
MIRSRLLSSNPRKRHSYLAIVPLPDETAAFRAYRVLQSCGISPEHLAIVGEGYSSPQRIGLLEPWPMATAKARQFAVRIGTSGAAIALLAVAVWHWGFDYPLDFHLLSVIPACAIVGGFFGAVLGALLSFLTEGSTVGVYHHHLRQGGYLLMIEGSQKLVRRGQDVLKQYMSPKAR